MDSLEQKTSSSPIFYRYSFIVLFVFGFCYWDYLSASMSVPKGDNPLQGLGQGIALMGMILSSSVNLMVFIASLNLRRLPHNILIISLALLPWFCAGVFRQPLALEFLIVLNVGILWRLSRMPRVQAMFTHSPFYFALSFAGILLAPQIAFYWQRLNLPSSAMEADLRLFDELSADDTDRLFQALAKRPDWEVFEDAAFRREPDGRLSPFSGIRWSTSHYPCCDRVLDTRVAIFRSTQDDRACRISDTENRTTTTGDLQDKKHRVRLLTGRIAESRVYESCLLFKGQSLSIGIFETSSVRKREFTRGVLADLQKLINELKL